MSNLTNFAMQGEGATAGPCVGALAGDPGSVHIDTEPRFPTLGRAVASFGTPALMAAGSKS